MVNLPYKIIYIDPPWKYADRGCQGTMQNHYDGLDLKIMKKLTINELADEDCVLFIWTTYPMLKECLELIEAWGFKYKTIAFQWVKLNKSGKGYFFGLGRWTRGNTECCLLATKGKPKRINNSISQLIFSKRREHSRKPDIVRKKIIELVGNLPRIELFARQKFDGWDCWGNEAPTEVQKLLKS